MVAAIAAQWRSPRCKGGNSRRPREESLPRKGDRESWLRCSLALGFPHARVTAQAALSAAGVLGCWAAALRTVQYKKYSTGLYCSPQRG